MANYLLESLSSMVHFPFNRVKKLELSNNCAKRQVKVWDRLFFCSDLKFTAIYPPIALFRLKTGRCRGRNWLYGNQAARATNQL